MDIDVVDGDMDGTRNAGFSSSSSGIAGSESMIGSGWRETCLFGQF